MFEFISDPSRPESSVLVHLSDGSKVVAWVKGDKWGITSDSSHRWNAIYPRPSTDRGWTLFGLVERVNDIEYSNANGIYRSWGSESDPIYLGMKDFILATGAMREKPAR